VGILSRYHSLKEHIRIYRFQASESLGENRVFSELIKQRWKTILRLCLLVAVSFFADLAVAYWITPAVISQPWYNSTRNLLQLPQTDAVIGLLSSVISGIAAVIGILLAISLLVFQLAAEKYPYRMVRFLIQEKVGAYVIDFLIISLLFSLWTLFLLNRGTIFPVVSIIISLAIATLSIIFVFVYRDYSLYFFRPMQGFRAVGQQAQNLITTLFDKGDSLGPSVAKHLRERTDDNIQVIRDFIRILSKKKDPDLCYGSIELAKILSLYITKKRFISTQSAWFPTIDVPTSAQADIISYDLLAPFEEMALGERYFQKPNLEWLEKEVLYTLKIAQTKSLKNNDLMSINFSLKGYNLIIEKCFEHQEYAILDITLSNIENFLNVALERNRLDKAIEFYNLMLLVAEKTLQGIDIEKFKAILSNILWSSEDEVIQLQLPKIFNDQLLNYLKKIKTEILLEKKLITPKSLIEADLIKSIGDDEKSISQKYSSRIFNLLSRVFTDVSSKRQENQIRNVLLLELRVLRRSIVLNKTVLIHPNLKNITDHTIQGYQNLSNSLLRKEIFKELKLGCLNSIKSKDDECFGELIETMVEVIPFEFEDGENFYPDEALESLMAVSSLAFLYSEFYQDKELFYTLVGILYKKFDLVKLTRIFEFLMQKRGFSQSMAYSVKYHHWFKDVFLKIIDLPMVERQRTPGFRGIDMVYDHPSELIQNSHMSLDIDDCTEAMIEQLRGLLTK
jgi:hypothetical protein